MYPSTPAAPATPAACPRGRSEPVTRARLSRGRRVVFCVATLAVAWLAARDATVGGAVAPAALVPLRRAIAAVEARGPLFRRTWVNPSEHTVSVHGSAICDLPSGDQLAVWYGGAREGAADVALFTARRTARSEAWSLPEKVVDRVSAAGELERIVKKVGNAVVFPDRTGLVWMVYVTVTMGGWSGSALNVKSSRDEGRTWTRSQRLTLNPFLNVSTLVRNKPILATDGRIGLPVYHELAWKFPQMLWLTPGADGVVQEYRIRNLSMESRLIQPSLVPLGEDRVLMMLRDQTDERRVHTAYSEDNGWTWSEMAASGLPNPDAAIDALRLRDGRILVAYNDAISGRENLRLAVSPDQGRTWKPGPEIEAGEGKEYSYPFMMEDDAGRIHLTYTWERKRIRHVEFNVAWLDNPGLAKEATAQ